MTEDKLELGDAGPGVPAVCELRVGVMHGYVVVQVMFRDQNWSIPMSPSMAIELSAALVEAGLTLAQAGESPERLDS